MSRLVDVCVCGCLWDRHDREEYHPGDYCGRCRDCDHWRPVRVRWWQWWRPRFRIPDTIAGLPPARLKEVI